MSIQSDSFTSTTRCEIAGKVKLWMPFDTGTGTTLEEHVSGDTCSILAYTNNGNGSSVPLALSSTVTLSNLDLDFGSSSVLILLVRDWTVSETSTVLGDGNNANARMALSSTTNGTCSFADSTGSQQWASGWGLDLDGGTPLKLAVIIDRSKSQIYAYQGSGTISRVTAPKGLDYMPINSGGTLNVPANPLNAGESPWKVGNANVFGYALIELHKGVPTNIEEVSQYILDRMHTTGVATAAYPRKSSWLAGWHDIAQF